MYFAVWCYLTGSSCNADEDELSMTSKCYSKVHSSSRFTWYSASNDCLSRGGSLAVFTDIGRLSDNSDLIQWLNTSGPHIYYWIGLVRSWWKTADKGTVISLVIYSVSKK